jgi:prevent-host-death family protein
MTSTPNLDIVIDCHDVERLLDFWAAALGYRRRLAPPLPLPARRHVLVPQGLTRDTVMVMAEVTIRELRNHGGAVVDRVERGEHLTVTRAGRPVAELRPLRSSGLSREQLMERRRRLPAVDPARLRAEIDDVVESTLGTP